MQTVEVPGRVILSLQTPTQAPAVADHKVTKKPGEQDGRKTTVKHCIPDCKHKGKDTKKWYNAICANYGCTLSALA
jgi:hypothetical protein